MMKHGITFLIVILLLSVGGLYWYWYEWRPSEIRKACIEETDEAYWKPFPGTDTPLALMEGSEGFQERYYLDCLVRSGLSITKEVAPPWDS